MTSYQYLLLVVFSIIIWLMVVDPNVAEYVNLIFKIVGVNFRRFLWMVQYHPKNPITNFIMERKYERLAKELEEELLKTKS